MTLPSRGRFFVSPRRSVDVAERDWLDVTTRLVEDFQLEACFLLNREKQKWVGGQPPQAFRSFLAELFKTKPAAYFEEIRFFKFNEDDKKEKSRKVTRYLALIPLGLKDVNFHFLGLIYQNQDQLQELLKFRIMPMYLQFWLHQYVLMARVRAKDDRSTELVEALEEKRIYAQRLERRVKSLNREIAHIREAELDLDQKVAELSRMLEEQGREYNELAGSYKNLFEDYQEVQTQQLQDSVAFEKTIYGLEIELNNLTAELRNNEQALLEARSAGSSEEFLALRKQVKDLEMRLKKAEDLARTNQQKFKVLKNEYGNVKPPQVRKLMESLKLLQHQLEQYRKRCRQLEQALARYRKQEAKRIKPPEL